MAAKNAARKSSVKRSAARAARPGRPSRKFTTRQRRFIDEYAVDGNATQAAIRAGFTVKAAKEAGYQLLTNTHVAAAIEKNEKARSERVGFTADDALRKLIPLTDTNIKNFIAKDKHGNYRLAGVAELAELPDDVTAQLTSVKQTERYDHDGNAILETEFRLHDRVRAITQAGKHRAVQAWAERLEVINSLAATVEELKRRRAG